MSEARSILLASAAGLAAIRSHAPPALLARFLDDVLVIVTSMLHRCFAAAAMPLASAEPFRRSSLSLTGESLQICEPDNNMDNSHLPNARI